jgi:hypothetical protein
MHVRLTICRQYADDVQPIVVTGLLVPPFVNPTVFENDVLAAMFTALGVTSADIVVESVDGEDERPGMHPYIDLSQTKNSRRTVRGTTVTDAQEETFACRACQMLKTVLPGDKQGIHLPKCRWGVARLALRSQVPL